MSVQPTGQRNSTYEKGKQLEYRVADIYTQLGAISVQMNLRIAGHQVDVFVELQSPEGFLTKIAIDCKNYESNVGVNEITSSAQKLSLLRQAGEVDIPVIVSTSGFTPEASTSAGAIGVKLITLAALQNRIADFTSYLQRAIQKYEETTFHTRGLYRRLRCTAETGRDLGFLDDFARKWLATKGNFITILGDYGTGKTTFAERLFWELGHDYLCDPLNNRIPVFIPLKRYRKEINIRSLITDLLLHEYGVRIRDYTVFRSLNEQGRLILILDAFDEMAAGADEAEVISNFRELKSLVCEDAQIVLTCRTHFFKDQDQIHKVHCGTTLYREVDKHESFFLCHVSRFTPEDVNELIIRYEPDRAPDYVAAIENTYNLKALASHPILLDMILTTIPEVLSGQKLVTPSDLYRTYTRFWLDRDDWRTRMTHEQREFFMKELAFYFQFNGITEVHFQKLPRYIRQKFPGLRSFKELDYFEADVRTCTFLVRDPYGHYSFVHRSFCEYFAALCACEHLKEGRWPRQLWEGKPHQPASWVTPETAQFAIDILEKEDAFPILYSVLHAPRLDGAIILNLARILRHSQKPVHKMFFDKLFAMTQERRLHSVDFRNEIAAAGKTFHGPDWEVVDERFGEFLRNLKDRRQSTSEAQRGGGR